MRSNYKQALITVLAFSGIILLTIVGCNSGANPSPTPFTGALELLYPKGGNGQAFKVGDTVPIRWSIHDRNQVASVGIAYSLDNGKSWSAYPIGSDSYTYPDTMHKWVPTGDQVSTQFVLKVYEYNNKTPKDQSAPFTIHN